MALALAWDVHSMTELQDTKGQKWGFPKKGDPNIVSTLNSRGLE